MKLDGSRLIWVQLVDDFRRRIVSGRWPPGAKIPSVRELATDAGVNPNTVQRALSELDRAGLTVTERTAGRFVTTDVTVVAAVRHRLATATTDTYIETVAAMGMDLGETTELLQQRWSIHGGPTPGDAS